MILSINVKLNETFLKKPSFKTFSLSLSLIHLMGSLLFLVCLIHFSNGGGRQEFSPSCLGIKALQHTHTPVVTEDDRISVFGLAGGRLHTPQNHTTEENHHSLAPYSAAQQSSLQHIQRVSQPNPPSKERRHCLSMQVLLGKGVLKEWEGGGVYIFHQMRY